MLQFYFFFSRGTCQVSRGKKHKKMLHSVFKTPLKQWRKHWNGSAGLKCKGSNDKSCLSHLKGLHWKGKMPWKAIESCKITACRSVQKKFADLMFALCGCAEIYWTLEAPAVTWRHQGAPKSRQYFHNWICDFLFLFFCLQNASYGDRKWIFMRVVS